MIEKFADMKGQLSELAIALNKFSSEAVQLRLLDLILGKQEASGQATSKEPGKTARKVSRRKAPNAKKDVVAHPEKQKKASSGTGARATLTQLLGKPFFDKPQTINSIIEHCKDNRARVFKQNEFSGSLARMVRNGQLTRKKNSDNQYEYKKS